MKIYLVRHGQTTSDIEDRYGGTYDDSLTSLGREQLAHTALHMQHSKIQIIFTSPLKRAQESAHIIQSICTVPVEVVEGLKERYYGILTGLTKTEASEKYPEAVAAHKDPLNTDPEGESLLDFKQRVLTAFEYIQNAQYDTIAVVAHGGSIKRILEYIGHSIPNTIKDGEIIEIEI